MFSYFYNTLGIMGSQSSSHHTLRTFFQIGLSSTNLGSVVKVDFSPESTELLSTSKLRNTRFVYELPV